MPKFVYHSVPFQSVTYDVLLERIGITPEREIPTFEIKLNKPMHIGVRDLCHVLCLSAQVNRRKRVQRTFSFSIWSQLFCSVYHCKSVLRVSVSAIREETSSFLVLV